MILKYSNYYFDEIIRFWDTDINFRDILLDEKLNKENYQNILTSTGAKLLCIRFDEIDGFIKIRDRTRYLVRLDIFNIIWSWLVWQNLW